MLSLGRALPELPPGLVGVQASLSAKGQAAAARLTVVEDLTASAVSHQVARLESYLGIRLFERSAHGVRITTAGESYLARIQGAISAITAAFSCCVASLRAGFGAKTYSRAVDEDRT